MKMSDVTFNTRMTEGGPNIDATLTFIGAESVNAAAHAVYRFDTLTQLNKELVEALYCADNAMFTRAADKIALREMVIKPLLAKAKELAE